MQMFYNGKLLFSRNKVYNLTKNCNWFYSGKLLFSHSREYNLIKNKCICSCPKVHGIQQFLFL